MCNTISVLLIKRLSVALNLHIYRLCVCIFPKFTLHIRVCGAIYQGINALFNVFQCQLMHNLIPTGYLHSTYNLNIVLV